MGLKEKVQVQREQVQWEQEQRVLKEFERPVAVAAEVPVLPK